MSQAEIKILGIRHHGAGSCLRMIKALESFQPDAICIELPLETESALAQLSETGNQCPLAFLLYEEAHPQNCFYLPFADFSPEYQAIKYGIQTNIKIFAMDMPAQYALIGSQFSQKDPKNLVADQKNIIRDPLGYLAKLQGYKDSEIWWTQYFEQWTDHSQLFEVIQQLMIELRSRSKDLDDEETLVREKFMRQRIKTCIQEGYQKIAVVCGAWHGPVLTPEYLHSKSAEKISNYRSVKTSCALIPWSYPRLLLNGHYTAGVKSPAWNDSLFNQPDAPLSHWLTRAAREFREYGYMIGTSDIIDAENLAYQLTYLRGLVHPGIQELEETLICIFGQGDPHRIQLLSEKIFVGDKIGKITVENHKLPFIQEFHKQLKQLNLNSYWGQENEKALQLDLRKPKHLEKSRFIHKTLLLQLKWAFQLNLDFSAKGNFHEHWKFEWNPELELRLIQLAILGNTFHEVILRILNELLLSKKTDLAMLGSVLEHALKAGMDEVFKDISILLHANCLEIEDVAELSRLIRPLVAGISYGNLHDYDIQHTQQLVQLILPRMVFNFGHQCQGIQDEKARQMCEVMLTIHSSFYHLKDETLKQEWKEQVNRFSIDPTVHPIVRGKGISLSMDEEWMSEKDLSDRLIIECGDQHSPMNTALWIEGFLLTASAFHLNKDEMIQTLNEWLVQLTEEHFKAVLPLLRRSFSQISYGELVRIKRSVRKKENTPEKISLVDWTLREDLLEMVRKKLNFYSSSPN